MDLPVHLRVVGWFVSLIHEQLGIINLLGQMEKLNSGVVCALGLPCPSLPILHGLEHTVLACRPPAPHV